MNEDKVIYEVIDEIIGEIDEDPKTIKPIRPTMKEMYIVLVKDKDSTKVIAGEVTELNEEDQILVITDTSKKKHSYVMKEGIIVLKSKEADYHILDIERVIPFDVSILEKDTDQIEKQLTADIIQGLEISLDEIKEKDMIYTDVELRESLLSSLIDIYDAYDKFSQIKEINSVVDRFFDCLRNKQKISVYEITKDGTLPPWLIPLIDNPLKISDNEGDNRDTLDEVALLAEINESRHNDYFQVIRSVLDRFIPMNPSLSDIGYTSHSCVKKYIRSCLLDNSCLGLQGNYSYDKRSNKHSLVINDTIIHKPDTLNIVGLLFIPDNHLIQSLCINRVSNLYLREKLILQKVIQTHYHKIHQLKYQTIQSKTTDDSIHDSLDILTSYMFTKRMNEKEFYEYVSKLHPPPLAVINQLDTSVKQSLVNLDDIKRIFIKYNIDIKSLSKQDNSAILKLLSENYTNYVGTFPILPETKVRIVKKDISINDKITKSLSLIMNMVSIIKRNEYLQSFIKLFTREPYANEDRHSLYNVYTNDVLLCKHYLFSSTYHTNRDIHNSMISIYGKPPEDGVIYCKHCGEFLCNEEFSAFDGFDDETPIQLREVMKQDTNLLDEFKEDQILLVKTISSALGITLSDEDIHFLLTIFIPLNQDIIANCRYTTKNIAESDEHPIVESIKKKYAKEKRKKELIKADIRKFQSYLKDTNKIISLISLLIIIIQTAIPTYQHKTNYSFDYLEFKKSISIESLTFNTSVIDYCIVKLHKLCKLNEGSIWLHSTELLKEDKVYDVNSIKQQIVNLTQLFISPQFNALQTRIIDYGKYLVNSQISYIKDEWALFKPLRNNKQIKRCDDLLQEKDSLYKPYYILDYNNYPVENVSLVTPLSDQKLIHELIKLPVSEIMINQSFLLLFKKVISNYGEMKRVSPGLYLHMERFIQTIQEKDDIKQIFEKHGVHIEKPKHTSYKTLRTKIIPEIMQHYQTKKQSLEPCYSEEVDHCNRFIHIHMNNFDYFLLSGTPKRFYKYVTPTIYPDKSFDELSDEFKEKIFQRYCLDPNDNVIKRVLNESYLGKFLFPLQSDTDIDIPDSIRNFERSMTNDEKSFKHILTTIQSNVLKPYTYRIPKLFTIDDYHIKIYRGSIDTESTIIQLFTDNSFFDLEEHPFIDKLMVYCEKFTKGDPTHKIATDAHEMRKV